jgi:hypothetical protein
VAFHREAKNSLKKAFVRSQLRLDGIYFTLGTVL